MSLPALAFEPLAGDAARAVERVPAVPGVGQIAAAGGRNLVVGIASNLRRWAASHLGLGKKPAAGKRPKTDLSGIAEAIGWLETDGPFRQRLVYERLLAPVVPAAERRDLKPPVFLQLDPGRRFPRVAVRGAEPGLGHVFGPFRERRAAEKARDALHRLFPLRPCDYEFEPDPELPLGKACLYAQVRSCAAPCLARVGEDEYRELARRAAAWLADPSQRDGAIAATVSTCESRAVVVDAGRHTVGLVPLRAGRVLDERVLVAAPQELDAALDRLEWPAVEGRDDWPWITAWLRSPKARGSYLILRDDEDRMSLLARVQAALPARFGDKLGATRGQD